MPTFTALTTLMGRDPAYALGDAMEALTPEPTGVGVFEVEDGSGLWEVGGKYPVWMSHGDRVTQLPEGFEVVASVLGEEAGEGLAGEEVGRHGSNRAAEAHGHRSARSSDDDERAGRRQHAAELRDRPVTGDVDDHVVASPGIGDVFAAVVDHVVGAVGG